MVGSVVTEGDRAMRSDEARRLFNLDGRGIKIGVISDSFNSAGLLKSDVRLGELPGRRNPNGYKKSVRILQDLHHGSDEGRAMAQIIHDVAPGAKLLFHTGANRFGQVTEATLTAAISALAAAGADIIVDDLGVTTTLLQDGQAAQTIDALADQGIVYVSAAGNDGDRSYQSEFRGSYMFSYQGCTYQAHDFDPGEGIDLFQDIQLVQEPRMMYPYFLDLLMGWDTPLGYQSNGNVEFFLLTSPELPSVANNGVTDAAFLTPATNIPSQELFYIPPRDETVYLLAARKVAPGMAVPETIQWVSIANGNDDVFMYEYVNDGVNSSRGGTVYGHPNARGAIAVGAAPYRRSPEFGSRVGAVEDFSSRGGVPILFDNTGQRLAVPEIRQKPDIVAPNGVSTGVVGFSSFFGTSAAAPHVAAVAALLFQRAGGSRSLSPDQIRCLLQQTCFPVEPVDTGFGIVQADRAVLQAAISIEGTPDQDILRGCRRPNNLFGGEGNDVLKGLHGYDALWGGAGQDRLQGGWGNDYLVGDGGQDELLGGRHDDTLVGGNGHDDLQGGPGDDWLQGGRGQDRLLGNQGRNTLEGGKGGDLFILSPGGIAIIQDFQIGQDQLGLLGGHTNQVNLVPWQDNTLLKMGNTILAGFPDRQLESLPDHSFVNL
jgi:subtilisin family serine protease